MPPRRRRRRAATPTPAQIWRILNSMAREARAAKREHAALVRRIERKEAARRKAEAVAWRTALDAEAAARQKALGAEAADRQKALDAEAAARKAEAVERQKALDAEAAARKAEAVERQKALDAEAAARQQAMAEHEEKMRRLDQRLRREQSERDRAWDRRFQQVAGEVDNRWGALAEGLVANDLLELLRDARLDVLSVVPGQPIKRDGETREYDLVAFGVNDTVVVEVKSTLRRADVTKFRKRMRDFRTWCPEHARPRVLGAMACLTADAAALGAAEAAGFYVIRAFDGTARILNPEDFEATIY